MRQISEDAFLRWASEVGLGLDSRYPHSPSLTYGVGEQGRFWCVPPKPEMRSHFLRTLLELLGDWRVRYVWRPMGSWPDPGGDIHPTRTNDAVELELLRGLELALGTADVLVFDRSELMKLVSALFLTTVFGWNQGDDVYVVPDDAGSFLQTDHHGVVHVTWPAGDDGSASMGRWIEAMQVSNFELPTELPDPTFERPGWMGPS